MKRKKYVALMLIIMCIVSTGCGRKKAEAVQIEPVNYEKIEYTEYDVMKGTLNPQFTMRLQAEDYTKVNYKTDVENLKIDKVYKSVGDKVTKGDLLISFKCDELQDKIDFYKEQTGQNNLLIDHYKKLMNIDSSEDYTNDIKLLERDNEVANLYIEEATEKIEGYQVKASIDGTITYVSDQVPYGTYTPAATMMTEVGGTGNYTTTVQKDYDFTIGEEFTAVSGIVSYQVRVIKVDDQTDDEGYTTQIITFEPVSDMSTVSDADILEVTVVKPVLENVIYVNEDTVKEYKDSYFVYRLDEDGFREAVPVTIGDKVDGNIVITSGLQEGEKVTR